MQTLSVKRCTQCLRTLPLEVFSKGGKGPDGTQYYKSRCKPCMNEQLRNGRESDVRNHFENVREEVSPHGKGIRKVLVPGWGYAGAVRRMRGHGSGRDNRPVPVRVEEAPRMAMPSDHGAEVLRALV